MPKLLLGTAKLWKLMPFTVVLATPVSPMLNAPTSEPVVLTSVSPVMFVAAPYVIEAACAEAGISARIVTANRLETA